MLVFFLAWGLTRNIAAPLRKLTAAAARIAEGDLAVKLAVNGQSETVGALSTTLGRMTTTLQEMACRCRADRRGEPSRYRSTGSQRDQLATAFVSMVENLPYR